jgi:hypothetical protein
MNAAGGLCILSGAYIGILFFGQSIAVVLWSAVITQFALMPAYYLIADK